MMLGLIPFGDYDCVFDYVLGVDGFTRIEMEGTIVDEISIDTTVDISASSDRTTWTYTTYILSRFQNDFEAGNISVFGLDVEYIQLKRRLKGDLDWQNYVKWDFDVERRVYNYLDRYVANDEVYEYMVIPVGVGGIEGKANANEIEVAFDDYFLVDKHSTYRMLFDVSYQNFKRTRPSAQFLPVDNWYPIVVYNGNLHYWEGTVVGRCFVEDICELENPETNFNKRASRLFRDNFVSFLNNKRPKILKDTQGNMWLNCIVDSVSVDFLEGYNNVLCDISFNWVEIEDSHNLQKLLANDMFDAVAK